MGTENFRIDKYQYEVRQDISKGMPREIAYLSLFDQKRNLLAVVAFVPDSMELVRPSESLTGHVAVQMHERHLDRIVAMLRTEKPVYFSWWREAESVCIGTSKEPVGEQELRKLFNVLYV